MRSRRAEQVAASGLRVLLLGRSDLPVDAPGAPGRVTPVALVVLEQRIRPDAADTLALSLDPYPRSPNAEAALKDAGVLSEEEASPFAALAALKGQLEKD